MIDTILGIASVVACAFIAQYLDHPELSLLVAVIGYLALFITPYSDQLPVTRAAACTYTGMVVIPLAIVCIGVFGFCILMGAAAPVAKTFSVCSMFALVASTIVIIAFGAAIFFERFVYYALSARVATMADMVAEHRAT